MKQMTNLETINGGGLPGCDRWGHQMVIKALLAGSPLSVQQLIAIYC